MKITPHSDGQHITATWTLTKLPTSLLPDILTQTHPTQKDNNYKTKQEVAIEQN